MFVFAGHRDRLRGSVTKGHRLQLDGVTALMKELDYSEVETKRMVEPGDHSKLGVPFQRTYWFPDNVAGRSDWNGWKVCLLSHVLIYSYTHASNVL